VPPRSAAPGACDPEVVFQTSAATPDESPRRGDQFFGHVDIAPDGVLTASLRDLSGAVLWRRDLEPDARA
jgi:alkaline phosphatase D